MESDQEKKQKAETKKEAKKTLQGAIEKIPILLSQYW